MSLLTVTMPPAYAHFNANNSVDSGEIRYENYTQWNDSLYWARDRWNYLGSINIAADTASTVTDLEVRDYRATADRCGYATTGRIGADLVALNSRYYDNYNTNRRRACTLHEFGHTLGLGHSYESQAMDPNPVASNPNYYVSPQGHDQADYRALWG